MKRYMIILSILISISLLPAQNNRFAKANKRQNQNQIMKQARQQANNTLEFIRIEIPEAYDKLEKLKTTHIKMYRRIVVRLSKRYRVIEKLRDTDSDSYEAAINNFKLEIKIQLLKNEYNKSSDSKEQEKLKAEIEILLRQSFDAKMEITANEIKRLESKLIEGKKKLEKRLKNKDKAIKLRLEQMLNEDIQW